MFPLDIVYCYVSETIPFSGDLDRLRKSFIANGFKEKQIDDTAWKYERGSSLALEFNYDSEAIQMQVFLKQSRFGEITVKVGNWGFPFEPLLMKNRFKKNLERMVREIITYGKLDVDEDEVQAIKLDAKIKNRAAKDYLKAIIIAATVVLGTSIVRGLIRYFIY